MNIQRIKNCENKDRERLVSRFVRMENNNNYLQFFIILIAFPLALPSFTEFLIAAFKYQLCIIQYRVYLLPDFSFLEDLLDVKS